MKDHFNNEETINYYEGDLLVIHGKEDEVINFKHGKQLEQIYNKKPNKKCTFISPPKMRHNYFDMTDDIVNPITSFFI